MPSVLAGLENGILLHHHARTSSPALLRSMLFMLAISTWCTKATVNSAHTAKGVASFSDHQRAVVGTHGADHKSMANIRKSLVVDSAMPSLMRQEGARSDAGKSDDAHQHEVKAMFTKGVDLECEQAQAEKAARKRNRAKSWTWALVESALQRTLGRKSANGPGPPSTPDDTEAVDGDPCADVTSPTGPSVMHKHVVETLPSDGEVDQIPAEKTDNTLSDTEATMDFIVFWVSAAMGTCFVMLLCAIFVQRIVVDKKANKLKKMREEKEKAEAEEKEKAKAEGSAAGSARGSRAGSDADF